MTTLHDWAGKGIGVNPTGSDYPFVAPADQDKGLLADLWLSHSSSAAVYPLAVRWIRGLQLAFASDSAAVELLDGEAHPVDITIVDDDSTVVFDSTDATEYRAKDFGDRLRIHEWVSDSAVCRIVQHRAFSDSSSVRAVPDLLWPVDGRIQARCSVCIPQRVTSLIVNGTQITGDVTLKGGYNNAISYLPNIEGYNYRNTGQITINLEAGTGLGVYGDCSDDTRPPVKKINQKAVSGDLQLSAGDCYWARVTVEYLYWYPPGCIDCEYTLIGKVTVPHSISIGNDCGPCCSCDDYVRVFKGLRRIHARYKKLGDVTTELRELYHRNRDRWLEQKQCREDNSLAITATAFTETTAVVTLSICGNTAKCVRHIRADFDLYHNEAGVATLVDPADYTIKNAVKNEDNGRYYIYPIVDNVAEWTGISPGRAAHIQMTIDHGEDPPAGSWTVCARITTEYVSNYPENNNLACSTYALLPATAGSVTP